MKTVNVRTRVWFAAADELAKFKAETISYHGKEHGTMIDIRKLTLIAMIGLLPLLTAFHPARQPDEELLHWEGSMDVVITGPKFAAEGALVTRYHLDVSWKEAKRIDVRDDTGRLTGRFILLEDDGSHWTGSAYGALTQGEGCGQLETVYAGSGAGSKTLEFGWVYYSMADDDPLADVLPNGAYHLSGDYDETIQGNMTFSFVICSVNQEVTQTNPYQFLSLGWAQVGRYLAHPLGDPGPNGFSVQALKANIEAMAPLLDQQIAVLDSEPRVLIDHRMTGHYTYTTPTTGDPQVDVTWDVARIRDIEPKLEQNEADRENWLPEGGDDASPTTVRAWLEDEQDLEGKWRFTLFETSREPGFALNAGDEDDFDLEFEAGQPGFQEPVRIADGWQIETTDTADEAKIAIHSLDYGAWSKVRAEIKVEGVWYTARSADTDDEFITVPYDGDEDHIADCWEKRQGVEDQDQNADDDEEPSGQHSGGDGIALYEEYRGFEDVDKAHQRLDPHTKELFVRDEDGMALLADFEQVSGLKVCYIGDDGWTGADSMSWGINPRKRVVNFNTSGFGHIVDQHALHVVLEAYAAYPNIDVKETPGDLLFGICLGDGVIQSPATCKRTIVFQDEVQAEVDAVIDRTFRGFEDPARPEPSPEQAAEMTTQYLIAIARHEMGHGVGAWHHVPSPYRGDPSCVMKYRNIAGIVYFHAESWPSTITKQADCCPPGCRMDCTCESGEPCWGQIQVSDKAR